MSKSPTRFWDRGTRGKPVIPHRAICRNGQAIPMQKWLGGSPHMWWQQIQYKRFNDPSKVKPVKLKLYLRKACWVPHQWLAFVAHTCAASLPRLMCSPWIVDSMDPIHTCYHMLSSSYSRTWCPNPWFHNVSQAQRLGRIQEAWSKQPPVVHTPTYLTTESSALSSKSLPRAAAVRLS